MQKPVFELREFFCQTGVSKSPRYQDLEEHIAVQMEYLRYLLEEGKADLYKDFFKNKYMNWVVSFCDQLAGSAQTDFYRGLAHFTRGTLSFETMSIDGLARGEEIAGKWWRL
jgi:thiosulfate reductase/polysulfide reductase chain A